MQVAPSSNAIQNNQKLFNSFSRRLASDDLATYASFAEKFAVWLSDGRAYYAEARPEILKMLKIAQLTLRRNVKANPDFNSPFHISSCINHPMVASYSRLLQAIHPFRDRFVEPDLQAAVRSLLKTATTPAASSASKSRSIDLTTDAQSPVPGITPPSTLDASTSRQLSSPTSVSVLQARPSSSSDMQPVHGPSLVEPSLQTSSVISAAAANGTETVPLPSVEGHSYSMPQDSTGPLRPVDTSFASTAVSVAPAPASLTSREQRPPMPLNLSTQADHGPVQIPSSAARRTEVSTNAGPSPATSPLGEHPAPLKPRKKKRKLDVGLESLIQADLQELRKRGVAVKQELVEPTNLSEIFDMRNARTLTSGATAPVPATQKAHDAVAETTARPQPGVIALGPDGLRASAVAGAQDVLRIDSTVSINEPVGRSTLPVPPTRTASLAMATDITETEHENDIIVDKAWQPPPPLENDQVAVLRHTSTEDIASTGPLTKTDLRIDEIAPSAAGVAPQRLPIVDLSHAAGATHGPICDTAQPTSTIVDTGHCVPVISPATISAAIDAESGNINSEIVESALTREPHTGITGAAPTYPLEKISLRLDTEMLEAVDTDIVTQSSLATSLVTPAPSASETPAQGRTPPAHVVSAHGGGSMPVSQAPTHGALSMSPRAAMPLSRSVSTSPTASVMSNPLLPPSATHPTSTHDTIAYLPASQPKTVLQPVEVNGVLSTIDQPSEGVSVSSGASLSAKNTACGIETQLAAAKDGILSASGREVSTHSAEELRALHAFGPGTVTFAAHKGLVKKSKATIRFDIPEEQFEALSLWRNRKERTEDLKGSLCLTLACYSRVSVKAETKTLEEVAALPSVWPTSGNLSMNVMYQGKRANFPLSPPIIVAPNGLVDVTDFLQKGPNIIELDQYADMSAYIFILRAHRPTGAQLEQVAQRQRKNQAWQDWLLRMCQPFEVPTPTPPAS